MEYLLVLACLVDGPLSASRLVSVLDSVGHTFACEADFKGAIRRLNEWGLVVKEGELISLTAAGRERLKADQRLIFLAAQREKFT